MGEVVETQETGRLEQVRLKMPEARFYFSGDRQQELATIRAFIGKEELEAVSLERVSDSGTGICYYVLLDVSASISEGEFNNIKEALAVFSQKLRAQDRLIVMTFGEKVQTVLDQSGEELASNPEMPDAICSLKNNDQRTLLFEAIAQMAKQTEEGTEQNDSRQLTFVITDGEDIARGKATKDEALRTLKKDGIPVYGFSVAGTKRETLNAFGEFCRESGGYLTVFEKGKESENLETVREGLLNSWEALFTADSNMVSNDMVSVSLEFTDTGKKQQTEILQNRWIADTEIPEITAVRLQGEKQLLVEFSEAVSGADAAGNYELHLMTDGTDAAAETEGEASSTAAPTVYIPATASAGSDNKSAVLSFTEKLEGGSYELRCSGIQDRSMEHNAMASVFALEAAGAESETTAASETETADETTESSSTGIWIAAGILVAAAAFFVGILLRSKKKKAERTAKEETRNQGGMQESAVEAVGNLQPRQHVKVETKQLEEKEIFLLPQGQKEELRTVVQKSMIVGRSNSCELSFEDPAMSRQHFALELISGKLFIRNLSQSSHTAVNGVKLTEKPMELNSGDWIEAGQLKLRIRF